MKKNYSNLENFNKNNKNILMRNICRSVRMNLRHQLSIKIIEKQIYRCNPPSKQVCSFMRIFHITNYSCRPYYYYYNVHHCTNSFHLRILIKFCILKKKRKNICRKIEKYIMSNYRDHILNSIFMNKHKKNNKKLFGEFIIFFVLKNS